MSAYPDACFITSAHRPEQFVPDEGTEIAVAGRSNAGKSSAINAIVDRKGLARTSKSPGRTQLINFFSLGDSRRLVDLPGYGYARVARSLREHWRDLLEAYFKDRASLTGLILVVDSRRLLGDFDWQMLDWSRVIGCPVHVLLTKADKLKKAAASNALLSVRREVPENVSVQLFSALKGQGVEQARRRLDELLRGCGSHGAKKEASGAEYRGAPEAKSTGLG